MQPTVDQHVGLETQLYMLIKIYLHNLVRFHRAVVILSGLEEPLEQEAIVVV
jgi:hypothetical protein